MIGLKLVSDEEIKSNIETVRIAFVVPLFHFQHEIPTTQYPNGELFS